LHLERAAEALRREHPVLSAGSPIQTWQKVLLAAVAVAFTAGVTLAPQTTLPAFLAALALPFFCVVLLRSLSLWHLWTRPRAVAQDARSDRPESARDPPAYTVLVPLYREAHVVPSLLKALSAIDYPEGRLEILLIVESIDLATRSALKAAALKAHMRVVTVPDGAPRTKPRALNYALLEARGDYVVVYDAEDIPEADQLRRAQALLSSNPRIGCVQARLNIYNSEASWLTRQFTIEYTALFDCILPTLQRLRLPVPLGGTSNHFPRRVLLEAGGWDPYNVTEDADLGIRLARRGWTVEVLDSTTWEEAPERFGVWRGQRTRWLKGWMQTYLVHMREPWRLLRELGLRRFLGLQALMGGVVLSALVHPWFYVLAVLDAALGLIAVAPDTVTGHALWWLGIFNLATGYVTAVALGGAAVSARGGRALATHALLMPIYWLLVSLAAYRALWQLVTAPYLWEKTEHAARARGNSGAGARPLGGVEGLDPARAGGSAVLSMRVGGSRRARSGRGPLARREAPQRTG
jgi:cellulose synthase/poly-beta-1,6-N-acetylglucosamine synthase-like glycosyltransferase